MAKPRRKSLPKSYVCVTILYPHDGEEAIQSKAFYFRFMPSTESFRSSTDKLVSVWRAGGGGVYARVVDVDDGKVNYVDDVLYSSRVQQGQHSFISFHGASINFAEALLNLGCISEAVFNYHRDEVIRLEKIEESLDKRKELIDQCAMLNLRLNKTQLAKIDKHYGTPPPKSLFEEEL